MLVLSLSGLARDSAAAPKKVGLVLSGGGARGAAHIGVLKVLEREQIPIDCIAGTSFGALVGGFYALGYSVSEIEEIFRRQDWDALFSDAPDRRLSPLFQRKNFRYLAELSFRGARPELPTGLWGGQKLIQELNAITTDRIVAAGYDFDRLRIPFRAVATDLLTGKPYVFRRGRMTEALRASIAIPMIFTPIEKDGMLLVDGGLTNNLPADLAREMGADFVIAVDVTSPLLEKDKIRDFFDIVDQTLSLMMKASVDANARLVDYTLRPDLEPFTYSDYGRFAEIVPRGVRIAEEKLSELRALTGGRRAPPREPAAPYPAPMIDSITFSGLAHVGAEDLREHVRSKPGELLDVQTLHGDLARLYATRHFERVDYELRPAGRERYQLDYSFEESPLHALGASIRYDRDYKFVALTEFNARQVFGTSAAATISSQFGGLENHQGVLRMSFPGVRSLFVEPGGHVRKRERLDMREGELVDKFTDRRAGGQILFGADLFNRLEITGGFRSERVRIIGGTEPHRENAARRISGLVLRLARDTLDAQEFPRSGNRTMLQATKLARSFGAEFDYSTWQADVEQYFSVSKVSTLRIGLTAALSHGDVPFYDRFFIGGYNFSDGAARQLLGFQRDEFAARQAALFSASYRRNLFSRPLSFIKHGYATAIYNVAALSDRDRSPYNPKFFNGFGAGIAIDTLMGPMRMVGGWGESGRFRLYLSLGPSF